MDIVDRLKACMRANQIHLEKSYADEINTLMAESFIEIQDLRTRISEQIAKPADGWISVSESLPEQGSEVFIFRDGNRIVAEFYSDSWWLHSLESDSYTYEIPTGYLPTHWQPLPAPPIEASKP